MSDATKSDQVTNRIDAIQRVGSIYVARTAVVVGDVEFGTDCNVWHHCVIRADVAPIRIGDRVNIQDGALLHCDYDVPLEIAEDVVIAHHAVVHGRRVGSRSLIGIHANVLDACEIGEDCLIATGAVVPPRTVIPDGSVVMGIPGKIVRGISDEERDYIRRICATYVELAQQYADGKIEPYRPGRK